MMFVFIVFGCFFAFGGLLLLITDYVSDEKAKGTVDALNEIEERNYIDAQKRGEVYVKTKWKVDL